MNRANAVHSTVDSWPLRPDIEEDEQMFLIRSVPPMKHLLSPLSHKKVGLLLLAAWAAPMMPVSGALQVVPVSLNLSFQSEVALDNVIFFYTQTGTQLLNRPFSFQEYQPIPAYSGPPGEAPTFHYELNGQGSFGAFPEGRFEEQFGFVLGTYRREDGTAGIVALLSEASADAALGNPFENTFPQSEATLLWWLENAGDPFSPENSSARMDLFNFNLATLDVQAPFESTGVANQYSLEGRLVSFSDGKAAGTVSGGLAIAQPTTVPEPGTFGLAVIGLLALFGSRLRLIPPLQIAAWTRFGCDTRPNLPRP